MMKNDEKLKDLADVLFDGDLISEEQKKAYEKKVFETSFTLKQQFLAYCLSGRRYAQFDREESSKLAKKYMDKFLEKIKHNPKGIDPDFSVFDDLLFVWQFGVCLV